MLKIKLARFGKKNQPHFRIIVNEARTKRDGEYMALIGHYSPAQTPKILEIDVKAFEEWLAKGAQPTDTVASLFKRFKSGNPFPKKTNTLSKKAKAKLIAEKEAANKPVEKTVKTPTEVAEPSTEVVEPAVEIAEAVAEVVEPAVEIAEAVAVSTSPAIKKTKVVETEKEEAK